MLFICTGVSAVSLYIVIYSHMMRQCNYYVSIYIGLDTTSCRMQSYQYSLEWCGLLSHSIHLRGYIVAVVYTYVHMIEQRSGRLRSKDLYYVATLQNGRTTLH